MQMDFEIHDNSQGELGQLFRDHRHSVDSEQFGTSPRDVSSGSQAPNSPRP